MITIIAEKPSVAKQISRVVGAMIKKKGYYGGNGYAVTWAYGHLVELLTQKHTESVLSVRSRCLSFPTSSSWYAVRRTRKMMRASWNRYRTSRICSTIQKRS